MNRYTLIRVLGLLTLLGLVGGGLRVQAATARNAIPLSPQTTPRPSPFPTETPTPSPTPTSLPTTTPVPTQPPLEPPGAYIRLHVTAPPRDLWTIVQWQDALGGWHDVEGWQGTLDAAELKTWWVAEKDFGTGPFRWALYGGRGSPFLATSEAFDLPDAPKRVVMVEVTIQPGNTIENDP